MTILSKKHQCINTFSTHLNETTPEKVTNEVFELFLLTGGTVKIESDEWQSLKEDITLRSGRASLPKSWSSKFAKKVQELNSYCCINFKRHVTDSDNNKHNLIKAWFYCSKYETIILKRSLNADIFFICGRIRHLKNEPKSFISRHLRSADQLLLQSSNSRF